MRLALAVAESSSVRATQVYSPVSSSVVLVIVSEKSFNEEKYGKLLNRSLLTRYFIPQRTCSLALKKGAVSQKPQQIAVPETHPKSVLLK